MTDASKAVSTIVPKASERTFSGSVYVRADWPGHFLHVEVAGSNITCRTPHELWYLLGHYLQTGELQLPLPPARSTPERAAEAAQVEAWLKANPGKARRQPPTTPGNPARHLSFEDLFK